MTDNQRILIAGAGPVGYAAALNLAHYGIPFTIFEATGAIFPARSSRRNLRGPARREFHDQLRAIAADKDRLRAYLRRAAMIEGVERAASIT